jgi:hypothetical protein
MRGFNFVIAALLLVAPLGAAHAAEDVAAQLQEHRTEVLGGRVFDLAQARLSGLSDKSCSAISPNLLSRKNRLGSLRPKAESETAEWLELYNDSKKVNGECKIALDKSEQRFEKSERKSFRALKVMVVPFCATTGPFLAAKCVAQLKNLVADLDPHCVKASAKTMDGVYSTNPCYAADIMIARKLRQPRDPRLVEIKEFTDRFSEAIQTAPPGPGQLDLWEVYRNGRASSADLREKFLATITMGLTSSRSSGDHVDGFAEVYWKSALQETNDAYEALTAFQRIKTLVDRIDTLIKWAATEKIELKVGNKSLKGMIRHDYMAAYLGCHYRNASALYHSFLPRLLGDGYESLDFKSHLEEKWTLKQATENFRTDTRRYKTGSAWGFSFCK